MMQKSIKTILVIMGCLGASFNISAQSAFVTETADKIRFEQYTGTSAGGLIYFWRMPTPGTSVFPGGNCTFLNIPADKPEHSSRFMALYLFAKANGKQVFYYYNPTTCSIISFGMDG